MLNSSNKDFTFPVNTPLTSTPSHINGLDYFNIQKSNSNSSSTSNTNSNSSVNTINQSQSQSQSQLQSQNTNNSLTLNSNSTITANSALTNAINNNINLNLNLNLNLNNLNNFKNITNSNDDKNIDNYNPSAYTVSTKSPQSSQTTIPHSAAYTINKHKRGLENTLFNSDSTLVEPDQFNLSSRVSSTNSENASISSSSIQTSLETQTLASLKIDEENEEDEEYDYVDAFKYNPTSKLTPINRSFTEALTTNIATNTTAPSSFASDNSSYEYSAPSSASSSLMSNRRLFNRSKLQGLGHRTTKSESFNLKLSGRKHDQKSLTQLNDLHEEISVSSASSTSSTSSTSISSERSPSKRSLRPRINISTSNNNISQSTDAISGPRFRSNTDDADDANNVANNASNASNTRNLTIEVPPTPSHVNNVSFSDYSKNNYFDPLPSAPVDSKNNFSLLTPTSSSSNLTQLYPSSLSATSSTSNFQSPLFSNVRKINPLLTSNLKNSSADSLPLSSSHKLRNNKLKLPSKVELLNSFQADKSIHDLYNKLGADYLPELLIIDVRPFHDYCKSHMHGSINICLPSTLLKRQTFTLEKCIQTLTSNEKILFNKYNSRDSNDLPAVLFYDDYDASENDISSSIFYLAGKFIQDSKWNSALYILEGGFKKFKDTQHSSLIDDNNSNLNSAISDTSISSTTSSSTSGNKLMISSDDNISSTSVNSIFSSHKTLSPYSMTSPSNINTKLFPPLETSGMKGKSPIGLSRFVLPDSSHIPVFKTRNYDEVLTSRTDSSIHLSSNLTQLERSNLPSWLNDVIGDDLGSSALTEKFNNLQMQERNRLNHALTKTDISNAKSTGDSPVISAGVELGRKNRYKDIFLYEHARVKLSKYDTQSKDLDSITNYINASYIHYPSSNLNYIATQGPLTETIGDFWNVVYFNNVPIILSLTPQSENQVEKCAPYWKSGTYYSNGIKIVVELVEEFIDFELSEKTEQCFCRRISVKVGEKASKEVLQVHMTNWPDFGVAICLEDILSLVALKRYISRKLDIESNPILVHCSAGCGRTGSFCVTDTCINLLLNKTKSNEISKDLIYDITSNFRSQRVFMVQTIRQYMLIYDTVIKYLKMQHDADNSNTTTYNDTLTDSGLVNWEIKDPGIIKRFIEAYR